MIYIIHIIIIHLMILFELNGLLRSCRGGHAIAAVVFKFWISIKHLKCNKLHFCDLFYYVKNRIKNFALIHWNFIWNCAIINEVLSLIVKNRINHIRNTGRPRLQDVDNFSNSNTLWIIVLSNDLLASNHSKLCSKEIST